MQNIVKKALLLGMGSVYYSKEKFEELMKKLNDENITPEESKKYVEETLSKAEDFRKEQAEEIKKVVKKTLEELGITKPVAEEKPPVKKKASNTKKQSK